MGTTAEAMPDRRTLESAVAPACRAPSLHNSQPWRWVLAANGLGLFSDNDRLLPATDASGRQMVLSCGAVLHHLSAALAAKLWTSVIERVPPSPDRQCLATLRFRRSNHLPEKDIRMAAAIRRRHTERLPMDPPPEWQQTVAPLWEVVEHTGVHLDEIGANERSALGDMSRAIGGARHADPAYQAELSWWTGHASYPDGIPPDALPAGRRAVAAGREFPGNAISDTTEEEDRATTLLLSTATDSRLDWLRCGEALSAVLLACTDRGLATCPVTHLTESVAPRAFLRGLTSFDGVSQVLLRVGIRTLSSKETVTPRRPLSEGLFREHPVAEDDARS